ncbi:MAG TPA: helix-turn-helix transcriptional regulator [Azospirillaceae bacterium]|nr:helix-turn-helix transcriptional regulator [Azospirillaceae bacterium]
MDENPRLGGTLEDLLAEEGIRDEVYDEAVKRVIAWQFEQAMQADGVAKAALAKAMGTSRTQVDRILDPENVAVSLETLDRAARALGKRLRITLEDAA